MTISFSEQLKQEEQKQYEREIKYAFCHIDFDKWTFAKILKDISAEVARLVSLESLVLVLVDNDVSVEVARLDSDEILVDKEFSAKEARLVS